MRRYLLALPVLLAVLAFAACGSDKSSSSSDETAATAAPTEAATDTPTAAPTETATQAASSGSSSGVKVSGKLGEKPTIKVAGAEPPTKLVIKDIKKGTGAEAKAGQTVSVNYVGALLKDGSVFDNSWDRGEAFTFPLGAGQVIPGWDQGVQGMKEGGRRLLIIPPDLAYGDTGAGGAIGPNEALAFVVDLDKVTSPK
jgi:peptidylprolyl isomerase